MSTVTTDTQLKGLMTRQKKARADLQEISTEVSRAKAKYNSAKELCDELQRQIDALQVNNNDIVITEHALLRWFERAMGFDLEEVKKSMINPRTAAAIKACRTCDVKTDSGFVLVVKNGNVVTVLEDV